MTAVSQPLSAQMPIVNPDGTPNTYFMRWAQIRQQDINNAGLTEAQVNALIAAAFLGRTINTTSPLTGGGHLDHDLTLALANSGVTPGTYGDATHSVVVTVDAHGLVTGVSVVPITGGGGTVVPNFAVAATGTGASQNITLPVSGLAVTSVVVFVNGLAYVTTSYTITGTTLTVTSNALGDLIEVRSISNDNSSQLVTATGTGASQAITIPTGGFTVTDVLVFVNGLQYPSTSYTISGTTLTMTSNASGDNIQIRTIPQGVSGGGGGKPWYFNPPLASSFTLSNTGCGDFTLSDDADVGMTVSCPPSLGSLNTAYALQTAPTGSWTMTSHAEGGLKAQEYIGFGLCLFETTTSKMISFFHMRIYGSSPSIAVDYWNSGSSFNSDQFAESNTGLMFDWRRIIYDSVGLTYTFQVSSNGKVWFTVLVVSSTAWLTVADKIGFMGGSNVSTTLFQFTVDNFSVV